MRNPDSTWLAAIKKLPYVANFWQLTFILLFINLFTLFFGKDNLLIAIPMITGLLMFQKVHLTLTMPWGPLTVSGFLLLFGLLPYLYNWHWLIGALATSSSLFIMMILTTAELAYRSYIPFILCYIFSQSSLTLEIAFIPRLLALGCGSFICGLTYFLTHKKLDNSKLSTPSTFFKQLKWHEPRVILASNMALSLTAASLITLAFGFNKGMWLSMTIMSLTQSQFTLTKSRMFARSIGTIIGITLYLILFQFLVPESYTLWLLLGLSYLYTFIKSYLVQLVFITINSLEAAQQLLSLEQSISARLFFLGCGILLVLVIQATSQLIVTMYKNKKSLPHSF